MPVSDFLWNVWLSVLDKTGFTVAGLTGLAVLYTRSAAVAYYAAGAVFCSLSVKVIKRVVHQPRPPAVAARRLKRSHGMPSTHSAAISYLATYILLASMFLPVHPSFHPAFNIRTVAPLVAIPWAVAVTMSRVWLGYHTWPQVFAGASYGVALGSVWFTVWTGGLNERTKGFETEVNTWIDGSLKL